MKLGAVLDMLFSTCGYRVVSIRKRNQEVELLWRDEWNSWECPVNEELYVKNVRDDEPLITVELW